MGLFNFVKDAGEKLWDAVTGQHDKRRSGEEGAGASEQNRYT